MFSKDPDERKCTRLIIWLVQFVIDLVEFNRIYLGLGYEEENEAPTGDLSHGQTTTEQKM